MSGQVQLTFEQKQQLCKLKKNNAKLTHANLIEKEEFFKLNPSMSQITRMLKAKETLARFIQEQPSTFDQGSQSRLQNNYVARVNRMQWASGAARRQADIRGYF